MPSAFFVMLLVFSVLSFMGWLISIIISIRSKRSKVLTMFLVFPPTNPFASLVLLVKDWKSGMVPVLCYVLSLVTFTLCGVIAENTENSPLRAYEQELVDSGETLSVQSLIPKAVSVESNIWAHLYLAPLGVAGQGTKEGEDARAGVTTRYASMSLPSKDSKIKYMDEGQKTGQPGLRELHHIALSIVSATDGVINESNTPQSWEACGEIIVAHFKNAEDEFAQLEEALTRPYDQYLYEWNDGSEMKHPHLGKLKQFTQSATMRSTAYSTMAESSASFRDAQLALSLIHTGDSDLRISRLVQMAQVKIALDTLRAAQQFHVWNDEQWSEVQTQLQKMDFPGPIPASIWVEAIIMQPSVKHAMLKESELAMAEHPVMRAICAPMVHGMIAKWLRLHLMAYFDTISAVETALENSRIQPWEDCKVGPLPWSLEDYEYGIIGQMAIRPLSKFFQKAINIQTRIELVLVACGLERYYLVNHQYPETLEELVPEYLDASPRDPMNHEPWHYRREEARGFRLYTVGENGRDDGGEFQYNNNEALRKDDILWSVEAVTPRLPKFEYNSSVSEPEPYEGMDTEMMRRYGFPE